MALRTSSIVIVVDDGRTTFSATAFLNGVRPHAEPDMPDYGCRYALDHINCCVARVSGDWLLFFSLPWFLILLTCCSYYYLDPDHLDPAGPG